MGLHLDLCLFWSEFYYLSNGDAEIFFAFVNDFLWIIFWMKDCWCGFPDWLERFLGGFLWMKKIFIDFLLKGLIVFWRYFLSLSNFWGLVLKNGLANVVFNVIFLFFYWRKANGLRRLLCMAVQILRLSVRKHFIRSNSQIWIGVESWAGASLQVAVLTLWRKVGIGLIKWINALNSNSFLLCSFGIKLVGFGSYKRVSIIKCRANSIRVRIWIQGFMFDQEGRPLEHFPIKPVVVKYFLRVILIVVHIIRLQSWKICWIVGIEPSRRRKVAVVHLIFSFDFKCT